MRLAPKDAPNLDVALIEVSCLIDSSDNFFTQLIGFSLSTNMKQHLRLECCLENFERMQLLSLVQVCEASSYIAVMPCE